MACSRLLSGLYRVSSGDQRTKEGKGADRGPDQGNLNFFVPQLYFFPWSYRET